MNWKGGQSLDLPPTRLVLTTCWTGCSHLALPAGGPPGAGNGLQGGAAGRSQPPDLRRAAQGRGLEEPGGRDDGRILGALLQHPLERVYYGRP